MNGFYDVVLILVILGGGVTFVNEMAYPVFGIHLPDSGFHISDNAVTEYQSSTEAVTIDDFTLMNYVFVGLKVLASAAFAVITIIPFVVTLLKMFGVSEMVAVLVALVLQGPVWFITISGWFEWTTGRSLT